MNLLAQNNTPLGTFNGIGPLGQVGGSLPNTTTLMTFNKIISALIGILTICAALWFIFQIFFGAFQWIASGSDKQGLENAKKRLTNGVIGLLIVVLSYAIIAIVGSIFGIPNIFDLTTLIAGSRVQ